MTVVRLWRSRRVGWLTVEGTGNRQEVTDLALLFPIPDSRFPIPDYRLPITDSRFPIPDSRFPIPDSRFPIPDSRFPIPFYQKFIKSKTSEKNIR
ncbi:hypothetical protein [Moorena sp. SIO4A5]|uniref:hypothetical protein n=1 Tax=Moorena sp. SIO4A5 TaxID=2607838 RepID=UPI0013BF8486|nr:hypothetical protein [Moorena sp. SIO4A5]NEO07169.1 hypothetical protein [Moorena sp. SIO3I8]NEQ59056.1 hypothetical protein [Moorena sp. SIO4A1]